VQEQFAEKFPGTPVPHCNAVHRFIEKFHETGSVLEAEVGDHLNLMIKG
jgi:hypothetical protein